MNTTTTTNPIALMSIDALENLDPANIPDEAFLGERDRSAGKLFYYGLYSSELDHFTMRGATLRHDEAVELCNSVKVDPYGELRYYGFDIAVVVDDFQTLTKVYDRVEAGEDVPTFFDHDDGGEYQVPWKDIHESVSYIKTVKFEDDEIPFC